MYSNQKKKENQIIGKTCDIIINRWTPKNKQKITQILMIISQQFSQKK